MALEYPFTHGWWNTAGTSIINTDGCWADGLINKRSIRWRCLNCCIRWWTGRGVMGLMAMSQCGGHNREDHDKLTLAKGALLRESLRKKPAPRSRCGSGNAVVLGSVKRLANWLLVRRICAVTGIMFSPFSSSRRVWTSDSGQKINQCQPSKTGAVPGNLRLRGNVELTLGEDIK